MQYGLPYKGSKSNIAAEIVGELPAAETFVDLFAGGCAVTHAAIVSGKYRRFIVNDIQVQYPRLFMDALRGNLPKPRVYTREEFEAAKESDAIAATCWSFGNNCKCYLWDAEIEQAKLTACRMILANDWKERMMLFKKLIGQLQEARKEYEYRLDNRERFRKEYGDISTSIREELCQYLSEAGKSRADVDRLLGTNGMAGHYFARSQWEFPTREAYDKIRDAMPNFPPFDYWGERIQSLQSLQSLQRLESLESLQRLQRLQSLQSLQSLKKLDATVTGLDYSEVEIPEDAVVYADPPYAGTNNYAVGFDPARFHAWLRSVSFPVFVSEYSMPADFVPIWHRRKICTLGAGNRAETIERLYVRADYADRYRLILR